MKRTSIGADAIATALGAVVLLVALLALPWYGVGEGKIAPIRIEQPAAPALHAQLEPPVQPELPEEVDPGAVPDGPEEDDFGAWTAQGPLGTVGNLVLLAAALAAAALAALRLVRRAAPPWSGALVAALGVAAAVVVVLRLLIRPEEIDGFEFEATLAAGGLVALAGAVLIAAGGILAMGASPTQDARAAQPGRR